MKNIILYSALLFSVILFSQEKDFNLPEGNEYFTKKDYSEAEANYRLSKAKNNKKTAASYNLGNAIYSQNQASEAKYAYAKAIETAKAKPEKHSAFHNIGNVFMKEKEYGKAVEAYKNALRNDPTDDETRYNYALAKKMLKENPPKKDKDKKDKDKKDKDKKDQPKEDKKDKSKEGDDKKEEGKPKEDKQDQQPQPQKANVPQERMKNLLDAVNNEEKKVQDKVNGKKAKGKPVDNEKDW